MLHLAYGYVRKYAGLPLEFRSRALARQFLGQTAQGDQVQHRRLLELVRRHADSQFGCDHHFGAIRSAADFRRQVPIRDYEGHEPYIARVRNGELGALFGPGTHVLMFAKTSGTTATPKTIPVTREALQDYRDGWTIWGIRAFDDHPTILNRGLKPILQIASDWRESFTPAGIPCGAITGLTSHMMNPLVRITYCMPPIASRIRDIESKYYVALRLSVPRDLGATMAANPSTLLAIARLGDREKETLIRDIADGTIDRRWDIPDEIRRALKVRTRWRRPRAARRLEAIVERTGRLLPRDYWPRMEFMGNWTGGTMGAYLRHFPEYFGERPIRDVGLVASEGRMTIPIADGTPAGLLDYTHHYFEFIPEDQGDREAPDTVEAADLVEGGRYFILLTTAGGLYRYHIHDLVRCAGFEGRVPLLEFLNKGAHFSSLTGEKLSEFQVVEALGAAQRALGLPLTSFLLLPAWGDPPFYRLLVEEADLKEGDAVAPRLAAEVDAQLQRVNVEYENKRSTLRLGPIRIGGLPPGAWLDFQKQRLTRSGGSVEQYKQPCLMADLGALDGFRYRDLGAAEPTPAAQRGG